MTEHVKIARVALVLLFSITFASIGWLAPVLYATYTPQDSIIEVHDFTAQDTTTGSDRHYICLDRTVHQPNTGRIFTELYLVDGGDQRVKIQSDSMQRYFQRGRSEAVTSLKLPSHTHSGEYRYLLVIKMELADGRVERTMAYESDTFTISEGQGNESTKPDGCDL